MQKTGGTNHTAFQFGHFSSLVWSRLVWYLWSDLKWKKSFTYGFDHLDAVNNHFLLYKAIWAWWQPNERTNNRVILEQACSCPVRRQSFAKSGFLYSSCITFRLRVRLWQFCSTLKTLISKFGSLTHWQCLLLSCLGVWTAEIDINNLCAEELVQQYIPDDIKQRKNFKKERVIPCSQIPVYNFETF